MSELGISERLRETMAVFHTARPGVPLTASEVGSELDMSQQSAADRLEKLAALNRLRMKTVGASGRIWWCPPGGHEPLHPASGSEQRDRAGEQRPPEPTGACGSARDVQSGIAEAVIDQSTRAEIESVVCARFAASDCYKFAWFGRADDTTRAVTLTAEAGVENYLDGVSATVGTNDADGDWPTARAFRTGELQTRHRADSGWDPWLGRAEKYGFCAAAAVPITHGGTTYGVVTVYTERPLAFIRRERAVLDRIGATVGHAIAAIEYRRALLTDGVVELRFHVPDFASGLDLGPVEGCIDMADIVPKRDDRYVVYGTTTGDAAGWLDSVVDHLDHWDRVEFPNGGSFELHLDQPPLIAPIAASGGAIVDAQIEAGQYYLTVQTPPGRGVRNVIETVQEAYPAAEMLARKQTTRDAGVTGGSGTDAPAELTDRQLAVLRAAYRAGFFEWPRDASGEDVADSLDIAAPTFHQHLRKAEKGVVTAFLSTVTA